MSDTEAKIIRLYEKGLGITTMCNIHKIPRKLINETLDRYKVQRRKLGWAVDNKGGNTLWRG